jgi:glycerol-3-phosphate dehydrogenase (NAD(P)+)
MPRRDRAHADAASPAGSRGAGGGRKPDERVVILGVGQMGLVCSAILTDPDRADGGRGGGGGDGGGGGGGPSVGVTLWAHSPEETSTLTQSRRSERLPGFKLREGVRVALREAEVFEGATLVVSAIPVQFMRTTWERLAPHLPAGVPVVSVAKGIEGTTLYRPSQIIAEVLTDDPNRGARPIGCLSGPTIAAELARCLPATMIAASDDEALRLKVQRLFTTRWLRVYTHHDLLGVELAGAIKNVIAIAAGILDGLHAGYNAKSALLARGLSEITRLGAAMGADPQTFFGVAGVGDLATTCFSPEGRNRSLGEALGKGAELDEYLRGQKHVVEGVATCRGVVDLARKYKVELPIVQAVHAVLFDQLDPIEAIGMLMTRAPKAERIG